MTQERSGVALRGFASMDVNKQREIARKGGANVPQEKRSFAQDRALAADAGRKGGRAVAPQARSFSTNRDLASEAGRKGGRAAQSERRRRLKEVGREARG
jgi:general stress protein YciG